MTHELEIALRAQALPEKAGMFEAYMKNNFPFLGVYQPIRKEVQKPFIQSWKQFPIVQKWEIVFDLWELEEREFQYVAMDFIRTFSKNELIKTDIERIENLLLSKSWWDSVDLLSSYLTGEYFKIFKSELEYWLEKWTESENVWLNRTTLLFQLKYKRATDFEILIRQILNLKHKDEFFIQKAIGWSLREYSKTEPELVRAFIEQTDLSKLARDEGMKKL